MFELARSRPWPAMIEIGPVYNMARHTRFFHISSRIQVIIYHNWSLLPLKTRQTSRSFCAAIQPLTKLVKACFLKFTVCFHNGFLTRISIDRRVLSRTKSKTCSKIAKFLSQKFWCPVTTYPLPCCAIKNCRIVTF